MNPEERNQLIEGFRDGYEALKSTLDAIPHDVWNYSPGPGRWTIHQIVVHIADSEVNGYVRLRTLLAEPGKMLMAYDQDRWAEILRYDQQNTDVALELFCLLRRASHSLLTAMPEESWSNSAEHPEDGTITAEDWLAAYAKHIPGHINQIKAAYEAW